MESALNALWIQEVSPSLVPPRSHGVVQKVEPSAPVPTIPQVTTFVSSTTHSVPRTHRRHYLACAEAAVVPAVQVVQGLEASVHLCAGMGTAPLGHQVPMRGRTKRWSSSQSQSQYSDEMKVPNVGGGEMSNSKATDARDADPSLVWSSCTSLATTDATTQSLTLELDPYGAAPLSHGAQ